MKKLVSTICLIVLLTGCVATRWDENTLEYTRIGGKEQIQGLVIKTNADGSFEINLENAEGDSEKSFEAFVDAVSQVAEIGKAMVAP